MKKISFLFFLLLLASPIFSQNSSYVIGESTTHPGGGDYLIKGDDLFHINPKAIVIYDKKTFKVKKNLPVKNFLVDEFIVVGYMEFQGEYFIFLQPSDIKKAKTIKFYFRKLDLETGSLGAEQFIFESDNVRLDWQENSFGFAAFNPTAKVNLSKDGTKLLFSCREKLYVYEKGMQLIWKTDSKYGQYVPKGLYDIQDEMIDNDGAYYTILKVFKNEGQPNMKWHDTGAYREVISSRDKRPNYDIVVLKIAKDGVSKIETRAFNEKFVHSLTLHRTADNKLICAGLCPSEINISRSLGFLSLELDGSNSKLNYYPIPKEIEYQTQKSMPETQKGMEYLWGLEIQNTSDGNLLLICEQNLSFDPAASSGACSGCHGNILVTKIDLLGKIIWMKRLTKWQLFTKGNNGCNSYKYLYLNDKHYIIYLDNKGNQELDLSTHGKYCQDCGSGYVFAYVLDDNGNVTKEPIFDLDKLSNRTTYNFKSYLKTISDTEFVFPTYQKDEKFALVKVTVK